MSDTTAETVFLGAAMICAACGAYCDYRERRIPNRLTAYSFVLGLALHLALGGWRSLANAALAGVAAGVVFLMFYLAGGMGGGDVKLMAAVGACAGMSHVAALLITTAIAGGAFAVAVALFAGRLRQTLRNVVILLEHHRSAGMRPHPDLNLGSSHAFRLPYGIAIGAGTTMTFIGALLGK